MSSSTNKRGDDFPYPPLPHGVDAIRILTISPGDFYDPIFCILTTAEFVNKPKYAALSYTWGTPFPDSELLPTSSGETLDAETHDQTQITPSTLKYSSKHTTSSPDTAETRKLSTINVNNTEMAIQHNLCLAMLHLRSPTYTLALWVDAICINQKDKMEVSYQVSLMSFIYSRAQTVIAWIGAKESKSHIDMFHHMSSFWRMGQSRYLGAALAQEKSSLMSRDMELTAVARIAASAYWTRLWIVQEVCQAQDLIFVYGQDVWTFDSFINCKTLRDIQAAFDNEAATLGGSYADFRAMLRILDCRKRRYSVMNSLETLIETFGTHSCEKIMDRIYGLLGMAYDVRPISGSNSKDDPTEAYLNSLDLEQEKIVEPTRGRGVLKIDYSSSLYELWVDVVKFVFFRAKTLQLKNKLGGDQYLQDQERRISLVRTAGVIQAALDQRVESDFLLLPKTSVTYSKPKIRVIGFLSGELLHIGLDYSSSIGSFQARQDWYSSWDNHYTENVDLERLHELDDRYTDKILKYSNKELARIRELYNPYVSAWRPSAKRQRTYSKSNLTQAPKDIHNAKSDAPRMFLGTGHLMGLVPPAAQVGDVIVQFWNCDAAIVMRPDHMPLDETTGYSAPSFSIVGRADVVELRDGKSAPGTDTWAEERICGSDNANLDGSEGSQAVYVDLDFDTLQAITASIRT